MKKITLLLLSLFMTAIAFGQENPNQGKIEASLGQSFATQQNQLAPVIEELQEDEAANAYWIAYARFYNSVFYLHTGRHEQAKKSADDAIQTLESIEEKNSEEHALLGYLLGFSISFEPSAAGRLGARAAGEYRNALKKDKNNMRAYLGMGESDFHKPAAYGGGKKVEEYLLKALSLPAQSMENGPSWGKNSAYHLLASYYKREGEMDKAKMYCMQGLSKYPQDPRLNELKQSF